MLTEAVSLRKRAARSAIVLIGDSVLTANATYSLLSSAIGEKSV